MAKFFKIFGIAFLIVCVGLFITVLASSSTDFWVVLSVFTVGLLGLMLIAVGDLMDRVDHAGYLPELWREMRHGLPEMPALRVRVQAVTSFRAEKGDDKMNKDGSRIRSIQIVLWGAFAAVLYSAGFTRGEWQNWVCSILVFALLCSYSYKNHPTEKRLKGIFVVLGIFCIGLILLYFLESRH